MSLYNTLFGVNPATFYILPMLGEKHPSEFPRFRDCFINEKNEIIIVTRVGGNNREMGYGEEELYQHPNFLRTEDDSFDSTFGYYFFSLPKEWEEDYQKVLVGDFTQTSKAYQERLYRVFPKLSEQFDDLFKKK